MHAVENMSYFLTSTSALDSLVALSSAHDALLGSEWKMLTLLWRVRVEWVLKTSTCAQTLTWHWAFPACTTLEQWQKTARTALTVTTSVTLERHANRCVNITIVTKKHDILTQQLVQSTSDACQTPLINCFVKEIHCVRPMHSLSTHCLSSHISPQAALLHVRSGLIIIFLARSKTKGSRTKMLKCEVIHLI